MERTKATSADHFALRLASFIVRLI